MRLRLGSKFFSLFMLTVLTSAIQASIRVQWVRDQGFPYVLTYKEQNVTAKYCYGEVEDLFSEKKTEILCRARDDGKCPVVNDCYEKRAVNGVIN